MATLRNVRSAVAAICVLAVGLWSVPTLGASSGSAIPNRAVKVAGNSEAGSSWGIWLFGKKGTGCWGTRSRYKGQLIGESVTCGFAVPDHRYQLAATGALPGRPQRGLVFFLVRSPEVHRLKVLVNKRSGRTQWIAVKAHPVHSRRWPTAEVPTGIGSAVGIVRGGEICPRRVIAVNVRQQVIARGSLPPCAGNRQL